jgi:hypothetical protein
MGNEYRAKEGKRLFNEPFQPLINKYLYKINERIKFIGYKFLCF